MTLTTYPSDSRVLALLMVALEELEELRASVDALVERQASDPERVAAPWPSNWGRNSTRRDELLASGG